MFQTLQIHVFSVAYDIVFKCEIELLVLLLLLLGGGAGGSLSHQCIQHMNIVRPLGYFAVGFKEPDDVKFALCGVGGENFNDIADHLFLFQEC